MDVPISSLRFGRGRHHFDRSRRTFGFRHRVLPHLSLSAAMGWGHSDRMRRLCFPCESTHSLFVTFFPSIDRHPQLISDPTAQRGRPARLFELVIACV